MFYRRCPYVEAYSLRRQAAEKDSLYPLRTLEGYRFVHRRLHIVYLTRWVGQFFLSCAEPHVERYPIPNRQRSWRWKEEIQDVASQHLFSSFCIVLHIAAFDGMCRARDR